MWFWRLHILVKTTWAADTSNTSLQRHVECRGSTATCSTTGQVFFSLFWLKASWWSKCQFYLPSCLVIQWSRHHFYNLTSVLSTKWRNKLTFLLPELIHAAEMSSLATTLPTMHRDQHQKLASRACVLQDQLTSLHSDTFVSVSSLPTQMTSLEDIYQTLQTLTGVVPSDNSICCAPLRLLSFFTTC